MFGKTIFTNEGQAWHQSHELLRPCFARSQVADLDMLEVHASRLMSDIPCDGLSIDLSKLFPHCTLSVSTDFLFGSGSGEALFGACGGTKDHFLEVWDRVSDFLVGGGHITETMFMSFPLYHFSVNNAEYERDCPGNPWYV